WREWIGETACLLGRSVCRCYFFFSSRRRHTRLVSDWSSDVCSSDLKVIGSVARTANNKLLSSRVKANAPASPITTPDTASASPRSEERRVGKEGRYRWWADD